MKNVIYLKGMKDFQKKLRKLPEIYRRELGGELEDAGHLWAERAKRDVPKDQGRLANDIRSGKRGDLTFSISVTLDYAAYVEFGTKTYVRIPPGLSSYASQFRGGKGSGGSAKRMIYEWMKRVGIPPERQWHVFKTIMAKGIKPHPFFFIQKPVVEKQFLANVRRIMEESRSL